MSNTPYHKPSTAPTTCKQERIARVGVISAIALALFVIGFIAFAHYRIFAIDKVGLDKIGDSSKLSRMWYELNLYKHVTFIDNNRVEAVQNAIKIRESEIYEAKQDYKTALICIAAVTDNDLTMSSTPYENKYRILILSGDYTGAAQCAKEYRNKMKKRELLHIDPEIIIPFTHALEAHAYRWANQYDKAYGSLMQAYSFLDQPTPGDDKAAALINRKKYGVYMLVCETYFLIGLLKLPNDDELYKHVMLYDAPFKGKYYYAARAYCDRRNGNFAMAQKHRDLADLDQYGFPVRTYGFKVPPE